MTSSPKPRPPVRPGALVVLMATSMLVPAPLLAQTAAPATDGLRAGFQDPPASARPRVWWHWMNGNITQDGIGKDLRWMKAAGLGGAQAFDANQATPQIVDKRLVYMTPEWKAAFGYAAQTADALGLELAIASSAGWSETGGPWVKPEDGMKKLVWSQILATGGKPLSLRLPAPPDVTGPYGDLPVGAEDAQPTSPRLYRDVRVLAYRVDQVDRTPTPRITLANGRPLDPTALTDDSLASVVAAPRGSASKPTTLLLDFDAPQTIRSATLFAPGSEASAARAGLEPRLEVSEDGVDWRKVATFTLTSAPSTISFAPVTAQHFRLVLAASAKGGLSSGFGIASGVDVSPIMALLGAGPHGLPIAELHLSGEARINQFEAKAGYATTPNYYALDADTGPDLAGVAPADVVDLTSRLKPDGSLDWSPPKGQWRIVRLGWSLIGKTNHPATPEATGLEVDKLDPAAVRRYLETYLASYGEAAGPGLLGARGVQTMVTDSTEVGPFNWTGEMIADFKRLRGYDPTPWLPTLTGVVIGSRTQSDAFLYDFRRTIADLHASAHYATVADVAHEHGLKLYGEALENGRPSLGDDMLMRSHADFPMAAMWTVPRGVPPRANFLADMKGAASVAHLYGQNIAAAESLTSILMPWASAPADLRQIIDQEFATGINRPVIHTSPHQPVDDKQPGLSLGPFGQYFTRHETWAGMARPWIDYIARTSFMLQQGRNVADVAYFYGEEAPLTALYGDAPVADAPRRYAYDFVNVDALNRLLSVDGTDLTAPSGARYRVLYLGGSSRRMTLPLLRRIAQLVENGATVVGEAPEGSPSLGDDVAEYAALKAKLWGGTAITKFGKGQVISGQPIETALQTLRLAPDFTYASASADAKADPELLFAHRKLPDGDAYFVDNRQFEAERVEARFRVTGKAPEIWRADTGTFAPASYRIEGDQTVVPLDMGPEESVFVVFREPATAPALTVAASTTTTVTTLDGPWTVALQEGRGAPASIRLEKLASLSENADPGVKYFSGVAAYRQSFTLPKAVGKGQDLSLDLGAIGDVAEVWLNGKRVGTAWHTPYRVSLGSAARPGQNDVEIRVANLWVNRLIGDAQPGATRIAYTSTPTYLAKAPLRPSGLLGPVTVLRTTSSSPAASSH